MLLMKSEMQMARLRLTELLEASELTAGMYVRTHGKHLVAGREERLTPQGKPEKYDRVRLTRIASSSWGLSVKRHTGRWEKTPFLCTLEEMVEIVHTLMQHLVAPYF